MIADGKFYTGFFVKQKSCVWDHIVSACVWCKDRKTEFAKPKHVQQLEELGACSSKACQSGADWTQGHNGASLKKLCPDPCRRFNPPPRRHRLEDVWVAAPPRAGLEVERREWFASQHQAPFSTYALAVRAKVRRQRHEPQTCEANADRREAGFRRAKLANTPSLSGRGHRARISHSGGVFFFCSGPFFRRCYGSR